MLINDGGGRGSGGGGTGPRMWSVIKELLDIKGS